MKFLKFSPLPRLLALITVPLGMVSGAPLAIFVSPSGNDANNGTSRTTPFATVQHARDAIRTINSSMTDDIVVNLLRGDYLVADTLRFGAGDSGTNGHQIVYQSADGTGTARIMGGFKVTGWSPFRGNIYRANIGANLSFTTLYENGIRCDMARWPKRTSPFATSRGGYMVYTATPNGNTFTVADDALSPDGTAFSPSGKNFSNAWVYGWVGADGHRWSSATTAMTAASGNTINVASSGGLGWAPDSLLVEHSLDLLTRPGEYYYDKAAGVLYYYSRVNGSISNQEIIVPRVVRLIEVAGSSPSAMVRNLQFKGLVLAATDRIAQSSVNNWNETDRPSYDATVYVTNAKGIRIQGCKIADSGISAVTFDAGTDACSVDSCLVERSGYHGVNLKAGANHSVNNCVIRYSGELRGHGCGVSVLSGTGHTLSHLDIYYAPRAGVALRAIGTHLSYVKVHDCIQDSGDQGAFYQVDPAGNNVYNQCTSLHNYVDSSCMDRPPTGFYHDRDSTGTAGTIYTNCDAGDRVATGAGDNQYWSFRHDPQHKGSGLVTFSNCSWQINYSAPANQQTRTPNVSFDPSKMQFDQIGVTNAFPPEYNDAGAKPAAPLNLWTEAGNTEATLHWTEVDHATSYSVKRATSLSGPFVLVGRVAVPKTGYDVGSHSTNSGLANGTRYYYTVSASNAAGEGNASLVVDITPSINGSGKLTGKVIGTNATAANAFDGNLSTWTTSSGWVGLDFGTAKVITQIAFTPSTSEEGSGTNSTAWMSGGQFQGSNDPGFATSTTLATLHGTKRGAITPILIPVAVFNHSPFRYVRYFQSGGNATIAEMQVFGAGGVSGPPPGGVANGTYHITNRASGKALTVSGTSVVQAAYTGATNQQWKVASLGSGKYSILDLNTGKSLDVTANSMANGALIEIWVHHGHDNQQWTFATTDSGYMTITSVHSGNIVEVAADGTRIDQWTSSGAPNQQWVFQP